MDIRNLIKYGGENGDIGGFDLQHLNPTQTSNSTCLRKLFFVLLFSNTRSVLSLFSFGPFVKRMFFIYFTQAVLARMESIVQDPHGLAPVKADDEEPGEDAEEDRFKSADE